MKISLIQPNLSESERYGKLSKVGPVCEPLGIAYLAGAIRDSNIAEAEIIDMIVLNYNKEDLIKHLHQTNPDIVGITVLTPSYSKVCELIKVIKVAFPKIKIILGGPHVTIFPLKTLEENCQVDIVCMGEGERTIIEILSYIKGEISIKKIKGIAYRNSEGKIKINKPRKVEIDIDKLPYPARELLPMERYCPAPTYFKEQPSYLLLASRGCPYNCAYCSKISGRIYRYHSIRRILQEMEILINKYNTKEIIFRDDTFTINRKHIIELCNKIISLGINKKIRWTCMTRVDIVDEELLNIMHKAGCWSIHYGVESGSQRLLNLINKDITIQQINQAFKWTRKARIEIKAFFMLGLPTETREESIRTIAFSKEIKPDWVQFTLTVPYPGTKLFDIAKSDGTLKSVKWEDYSTWSGWTNKELVFIPKNRNQEELKQLQRFALRSFYMRPKFIFSLLKYFQYLYDIKTLKVYINGFLALVRK